MIALRAARARLLEDLHASPETINPSETTHSELLEELKKLEKWLKDVKERQWAAPEPAVSGVFPLCDTAVGCGHVDC